MSYLMGWGDQFESHHYVAIYPGAIMAALQAKYPLLGNSSDQDQNHMVTMVSGVMTLRDQLNEYMFCGGEMVAMDLFTFLLNTYDAANPQESTSDGDPRCVGRLLNDHVPYQQGFNKTGHCCIFQTECHETLPHFMGGWMPRNDGPKDRQLYCASMLCLLKPWTNLGDLKTEEDTFEESFKHFVAGAKKKTPDILENTQYYYECYNGAKE
ncbi:hypothetical protein BYT27DRAFT_7219822 [Phlegmacium glaucopus]|nr:hypothetical protein BYT27DRAFT_7219822 [Phlegmacium glaucopus]